MGWLPHVRRFWLLMIKEVLEEGWLLFEPEFLSQKEADTLFHRLDGSLPWRQGKVTLFGKTFDTPRLESLHVFNGKSYHYSGNTLVAHPFTEELEDVKNKIELVSGESLTVFWPISIAMERTAMDGMPTMKKNSEEILSLHHSVWALNVDLI